MRVSCAVVWLLLGTDLWSGAWAQAADGATAFQTHCASCHTSPTQPDIPTRDEFATYPPATLVDIMTDGAMRLQAEPMSDAERVAVAEYLSGRTLAAGLPAAGAGQCPPGTSAYLPGAEVLWNGWGVDVRNNRYQPVTMLSAARLPQLRLKWAFGVPGATQSRSQPAAGGGQLFMGSQSGAIYALDARTGCIDWVFEAGAGVRTAITIGPAIGPATRPDGTGQAIYFADGRATAYAIDAAHGTLLWSRQVDEHPAARATGAPTLYDGRLYVPTSGVAEESTSAIPSYACCTFRGSITALDAATGDVLWKTYTMPEPKPRGTSTAGAQLWGPAGAPIWSAPTVDATRGLLYVATGNAYADPPRPTSNAVIAMDLKTGAVRWVKQLLPGDIWIMGCDLQTTGNPNAGANPNCPADVGPDFDFSASPMLVQTATGRELLVLTQKSGLAYAIDPDREGEVVWEYRWGTGSPIGGVWGAATDGTRAYFAVADQFTEHPGGVHAVDLATGARVWYTPPPAPLCAEGTGCSTAQSAAVTVIPGIVLAGSADGGMRAYDAATGAIVWTFDTNRAFATVNGVTANGGSIDGPGPVVAGAMLYVTSGNGGIVGRPGNVLLAFELAE